MKNKRIAKVIRVHPLGATSVSNFIQIHWVIVEMHDCSPFKSGRMTTTAIPRVMSLAWLHNSNGALEKSYTIKLEFSRYAQREREPRGLCKVLSNTNIKQKCQCTHNLSTN